MQHTKWFIYVVLLIMVYLEMLPKAQLVYQLYNNMLGTVCRVWLFWHVYCITVPVIVEHFQCNLNTTSGFSFPPFPTLLYPFLNFFLLPYWVVVMSC